MSEKCIFQEQTAKTGFSVGCKAPRSFEEPNALCIIDQSKRFSKEHCSNEQAEGCITDQIFEQAEVRSTDQIFKVPKERAVTPAKRKKEQEGR